MTNKILSCEQCPLVHLKEKEFYKPIGDPTISKWGLVIDFPIEQRSIKKLFVGVNPYVTLPVKCWRSLTVDSMPPARAVTLCRELYLNKELEQLGEKRIIAMGEASLWSLSGKKLSIRPVLGRPFIVGKNWVLAVYHPKSFFDTGSKIIIKCIKRSIVWATRGNKE